MRRSLRRRAGEVIRYAASVAVGVGAFVLAAVAFFVMMIPTYGPINHFGAERAGEPTRRLLMWLALLLVVGPAFGVLACVPFLAARRWRTSAVLAIAVAMSLGGIASYPVIVYISVVNACTLHVRVPYTGDASCG